jgi:3-isopropylmalate/(R)-2-methylmalate dehydratase large subunit
MHRTLYEKLFDDHVVLGTEDDAKVLYIDRHLIEDHASASAFASMASEGASVRAPHRSLATADHNAPLRPWSDKESRAQVATLNGNAAAFDIECFGIGDIRQGITHVIGAEQGFVLPGSTVVCGDSHTMTNGALGALTFGVGSSGVEHVLRTQSLVVKKAKTMRITLTDALSPRVEAKDAILAIIGQIGSAGAAGFAVEFAGPGIDAMSVEERMTVCNMATEAGAATSLMAPDGKVFAYLKAAPRAPQGEGWTNALSSWQDLRSDPSARFDAELEVAGELLAPMVTWGTSPDQVVAIDGCIPDPKTMVGHGKQEHAAQALTYMGLEAGMHMEGIPIDVVWIGSCTNGRIEDLRRAASVLKGRRISPRIDSAMVVPGSGLIKRQAEHEGLRDIFENAGFFWSEPGCSMCLGMNGDTARPGQRCASTSNRNFEHRQGFQVRTHLLSPSMAAAAAVTGCLTDVRKL